MKRVEQLTLIVTLLGFSWLAMQLVHECGHVVAAWASGAEVEKVVLHPCTFSRTDIGRNPCPLLVVWAGPATGVLLPLAVFLVARAGRMPLLYLWRFFAGFCLVANGTYIAFGPAQGGTDSAIMLAHGSPRWTLVLFGLCAAVLGVWLWHRQGVHFGLGPARGTVDRSAVVVSAGLLLLIVLVELVANGR